MNDLRKYPNHTPQHKMQMVLQEFARKNNLHPDTMLYVAATILEYVLDDLTRYGMIMRLSTPDGVGNFIGPTILKEEYKGCFRGELNKGFITRTAHQHEYEAAKHEQDEV